MKYLFLDNFRGFSKASIPLVDVNFLVGENSTGKTRDQSYFRLGVVEDYPLDKNGKSAATGTLFTFTEERGLPRISKLTRLTMGREVSLRFDCVGSA